MASRRVVRPKKITFKQTIPVFRDSQVEANDYEHTRDNVDIGVEKAEQDVSRFLSVVA